MVYGRIPHLRKTRQESDRVWGVGGVIVVETRYRWLLPEVHQLYIPLKVRSTICTPAVH